MNIWMEVHPIHGLQGQVKTGLKCFAGPKSQEAYPLLEEGDFKLTKYGELQKFENHDWISVPAEEQEKIFAEVDSMNLHYQNPVSNAIAFYRTKATYICPDCHGRGEVPVTFDGIRVMATCMTCMK